MDDLKCPVPSCGRVFSLRFAYTQHIETCLNKMEIESSSDEDNKTQNKTQNIDDKTQNKTQNINFEVINLFCKT